MARVRQTGSWPKPAIHISPDESLPHHRACQDGPSICGLPSIRAILDVMQAAYGTHLAKFAPSTAAGVYLWAASSLMTSWSGSTRSR